MTYDEMPMPGATHKPEEKQVYRRHLCLNGPFEGRGLIVPMPATFAWGYDLVTLKDGTHVAVTKEPEPCSDAC